MAALWEIDGGSIGDSPERAESSQAGRPPRIFSPTVKFNAGLAKDRKEGKASATDAPQACQGQPSVRLRGRDELEVALWPLTDRGKPYLMRCPAIFSDAAKPSASNCSVLRADIFFVAHRYPFLKLPIGVPYTWHSSHESANSFPVGGSVGRRTGFPRFFYSLS